MDRLEASPAGSDPIATPQNPRSASLQEKRRPPPPPASPPPSQPRTYPASPGDDWFDIEFELPGQSGSALQCSLAMAHHSSFVRHPVRTCEWVTYRSAARILVITLRLTSTHRIWQGRWLVSQLDELAAQSFPRD